MSKVASADLGQQGEGETDSLADLDIVTREEVQAEPPDRVLDSPPAMPDSPASSPASPALSLPDAPGSEPGSPDLQVSSGFTHLQSRINQHFGAGQFVLTATGDRLLVTEEGGGSWRGWWSGGGGAVRRPRPAAPPQPATEQWFYCDGIF